MIDFIVWCNRNEGFMAALLSLIGLFVSVISIIASIRAARLPYKKKLVLSVELAFKVSEDGKAGVIKNDFIGFSVNATNVGFRNINLDYLGISISANSLQLHGKILVKKPVDEITGKGIIKITEVKSEIYTKEDLRYALLDLKPNYKLNLYAIDTEGTEYRRRLGNVSDIIKSADLKRKESPSLMVDETWAKYHWGGK